jgi:hypothetical protein
LAIKKKQTKAKTKVKAKEPDLFSPPKEKKREKIKEWKFPLGVRFPDVIKGDIFVFEKARDWDNEGKIGTLKGEVIEKGTIDTKSKYFLVKMLHPERPGFDEEDIRKFIITKK